MMRALMLAFWLICLTVFSMPMFGSAIGGGSIQITGVYPFGSFTLSGSSFVAAGHFSNGSWGPTYCSPCTPGSLLRVDGLVVGNDFNGGSATINGMSFPSVNWGDLTPHGGFSSFMITGPGIVLSGAGTYVRSFSFTGSLCGTIVNEGVCAANLPTLTGSGQVAVQVTSMIDDGRTLLEFEQATYTFLPIPEPSSLLLVGSGVLGLVGVIRRKTKLSFV